MRWIRWGLLCLVVVGALLFFFLYRKASLQGHAAVDWRAWKQITFNAQGIPTVRGADWPALVETQGFLVASDRFWQMDLMRRSAAGRLAEWFGENPRVLEWDEKRRKEDWEGVATRGVEDLPAGEKAICDRFAAGANRFLREYTGRVSAEYILLGQAPVEWQCRDSLLVLLAMAEDLSKAVPEEISGEIWRRKLSPSWEAFFFSQEHPWNHPTFGNRSPKAFVAPKPALPKVPIGAADEAPEHLGDTFFPGSNAWVYRGEKGTFLANDPHLGATVPQLWYPIRFRLDGGDWAVGVSLPGIPGLVLGRNANIAWGFTNAKEDVDDLLREEVSPDGKRYVAAVVGGVKQWKAVEERPYTIETRSGEKKQGVARFTHRGPLLQIPALGPGWYSRQWIAFQKGFLRLPALAIVTARDWDGFNRAIDQFFLPAQAIVFADRQGGIGLRLSGRGIRRRVSGLVSQPALVGEWAGFESPAERPRVYLPPGKSAFLSTANERLWTKGFGEHWSSDLRQARLLDKLTNPRLDRAAMHGLQWDTHSRYFKELVEWIARHATPANKAQTRMIEAWKKWDGVATDSPVVFSQAAYARARLASLLVGRARRAFLPEDSETPYRWKLQNAWEVAILDAKRPDLIRAFGLEPKETATWLLAQAEIAAGGSQGYAKANRWKAQHPFAKAVPALGRLFGIDEHPQVGYDGVLRVERPESGASGRMVWEMGAGDAGSWSFPVGQSGHFLSPHYTGFRQAWFADSPAAAGIPD